MASIVARSAVIAHPPAEHQSADVNEIDGRAKQRMIGKDRIPGFEEVREHINGFR
jgi:hypothetical protein